MIPERLKQRLDKNRPMASITLRIPVNIAESLKSPQGGLGAHPAKLSAHRNPPRITTDPRKRWVTARPCKQKGLQGKTLQAFVLIEPVIRYSTVTDFAKLRGWSTSVPLISATW